MWQDRLVQLTRIRDGTDLRDMPATFTAEFDGAEYRAASQFSLPFAYEIPNLRKLVDDRSSFMLTAHDATAGRAAEISLPTDVDITMEGAIGDQSIVLYASRQTPAQRDILASAHMRRTPSAIMRTALLYRYTGMGRADRRPEILDALAKGNFDTPEQRRRAAWLRFSEGQLAAVRRQHRDAYEKFEEAANLMQPLVVDVLPTVQDATLIYRACSELVGI